MVHKRSHRGVHSGNTLRAFNSRYSRRYHNQACIVSRVRPELLHKLAGGKKADDMKPELHNIAVDVPLSLNKQSRWFLPSALIRQIRSNDIAESELTVSLLERHKLKRPASCVSFHSNKGDVKRIQPRNGRYFGFSYPTADGKSRRAVRRERREELLELTKNTTAGMLKGKTLEVFTEQGRAKRNLDIGESEVRYEVYYPSPAQSSISHNPKYIKQNVDAAPGEDEEHVQHGKSKKQHRGKQRKRISLKDLDECDLLSYHTHGNQPMTTIIENKDCLPHENVREEQNTIECLLSSLIEKAQQLQNFKGITKSRRKKKNDKSSSYHEEDKSHIVYLSEPLTQNFQKKNADQSTPLIQPFSPAPSELTRVMLPKEDVTMTTLKDCFGQSYFEAACKPRKFVLDVTSNVRELLKKQGIQAKVAEKSDDALSYLICIHDGFYDDEYDVYKVLLNSRLHKGLLAVQIDTAENEDLYRGTVMNLISQTMDFVEILVKTLKDKNHFPLYCEQTTIKAPNRHLNSHLGSAEAYVPSVQRLFQKGSNMSELVMPALSDMLEEDPVFCDVCYDDISPLTYGSAASTSVLKCGHHVCDLCWSQHIHVRLHEGFVRVTCPSYDCQEEVKVGVLLSIVPLDTVDKLLQRQEEVRIGASQTEKWCPSESCGRVIHLQPSSAGAELQLQQDVVCACGAHVCFQCLTPAHWPASCNQAEDYRTNLPAAVFPDRLAEVHDDYEADQEAKARRQHDGKTTMLVDGKHCPKCRTFVFKNGGCAQMACRCGQMFCWFCTKPGYAHHDRRGCVDVTQEKKLTTTVVVRHLEANKNLEETKKEKQSALVNRRQRMSLMERAVEHRKHHQSKQDNLHAIAIMAKTASAAAAKNEVLAQHIIKACSETFPSSSNLHSSTNTVCTELGPSTNATVLETTTRFLKNASRSKQELHEVVEYSLVLLKDLPDSVHRRRALRISEDLGAFCSFSQSVFDAWSGSGAGHGQLQEAVKAVMRLAEIHGWIQSALDSHIATVRKLRSLKSPQQ